MSRTLWISGALACLVAGAGFLLAQEQEKRPAPRRETPAPTAAPGPARVKILWPTPYSYFDNTPDPARFLQATASGKWESGGYGMVREGGARFHEGVDIRPMGRDRRGEPTDAVTAAMSGRVAYINTKTNGAYGRYVVLEHRVEGVTLYTLYAHLASIEPALRTGAAIAPGAHLGVMGRSDANGGFAKDRAHLHFEVGLRLSDNFARWYAGRRYPDPNAHGEFNGINLAGLNPEEFFLFARKAGGAPTGDELAAWVRDRVVSVVVETSARTLPNLLRRNPALIVGEKTATPPVGWRIGFTADGVPVRWEPMKQSPGAARVVAVDNERALEARRRGLIVSVHGKRNAYDFGSTLETALELAVE